MDTIKLNLPLSIEQIKGLRAGDKVEISGVVYTGRDVAHKRFNECLSRGEELPFDIEGGAIYYVGPTPAKPNQVIGACGPTSSYRMDEYSEPLLKKGLKVMIGKGPRSDEYKKLLKEYGAVYLSAIGGTAVDIAESVKECELVCYEDLGTEAVRRLKVENLFAVVTYDSNGGDLFLDGINKFSKKR